MDTSTKSEKHEDYDFLGSPKVKSNSYKSKTKQNRTTELLGYSKFEFTVKMAHQTSQTPDPHFSWFSI